MSKHHQNIVHIGRGRFAGEGAKGHSVAVTDGNRGRIEQMLQRDAELAYAAAADGRDYRSTIAIAA